MVERIFFNFMLFLYHRRLYDIRNVYTFNIFLYGAPATTKSYYYLLLLLKECFAVNCLPANKEIKIDALVAYNT